MYLWMCAQQIFRSDCASSQGWSGVAKVSCILHDRGVQLIFAYSLAWPAILVAGKGRGQMFLTLLFLYFHFSSLSSLSLSFISSTISSISFLPFSGRRHKMTHKGWCVIKPQHSQLCILAVWSESTECSVDSQESKISTGKQQRIWLDCTSSQSDQSLCCVLYG